MESSQSDSEVEVARDEVGKEKRQDAEKSNGT